MTGIRNNGTDAMLMEHRAIAKEECGAYFQEKVKGAITSIIRLKCCPTITRACQRVDDEALHLK